MEEVPLNSMFSLFYGFLLLSGGFFFMSKFDQCLIYHTYVLSGL